MNTMAPSARLTHRRLEAIRAQRDQTILLFLTDRCPVGCGHCSVDSKSNSPTITDFDLFEDITDWIARQNGYDVIGISGGEPFVEKRGLLEATKKFAAAGKSQVIFTSGVWAKLGKTPKWIPTVLARTNTIYLSTDGFHASQIDDDTFIRAAREVVVAGCWLVVQFIHEAKTEARVRRLVQTALGDEFANFAELNPTIALTNGRGADVFTVEATHFGRDLPSCHLARNPMVRYDGQFSACCNESVIMGRGPSRLRRKASTQSEMDAAISAFHNDPLISSIGGAGVGLLTKHPAFTDLADQKFCSSCDLCWKLMDRVDRNEKPANEDALLKSIAALEV